MTDQNSQFFAILTAVGEAKQANANAIGVPWTFAQMGVGDANGADPIPSRTQTRLINEQRRAPLNQIKIDPANSNIIIAEQIIPPDAGGWWIREIGLYDAAGDLVAVANCAPSFKPLLSQGTGKTQVVRLNIIVTSTANVQLKIDPAVVLATREYVDTSILNVLPPNKAAGTYTQVRIDARGVVQEGFNPTTLGGYGIADAFTRVQTKAEIAGAIVGKADLAGAQFTGSVRVPNVSAGNATDLAANTKFVADAIAALVASSPAALDTLKELATALGNDPNFAATMTNSLANKFDKTGGQISGQTVITTGAQSETEVGLVVQNPTDASDVWVGLALGARYGAANLKYRPPFNTLFFRNHATQFLHIDAGRVYSDSHPCHTDVSFMMPIAGQWITINGELTLPPSGTWAYSVSAYMSGGVQQPPKAAVVPGATTISGTGGTGFAWRIF